ncbi:hypothetical protein [Mesorhizobium sp. M7A.F.Ca.US.008.03.1.1]|uniref:hypothetical protein n=1 Tax=Mesorhizobium sp. M7A.F.Ca.US.008.03.1.1 TaxID=2496742 RepID=UPI001FE22CE2|nr:hypothetical protein [Mesorhizobium sp. M7A.F.Ca.US.008.03.1.1]
MAKALLLLPRPLRGWLYDRIARNRYALFGRRTAARSPHPICGSGSLARKRGSGKQRVKRLIVDADGFWLPHRSFALPMWL